MPRSLFTAPSSALWLDPYRQGLAQGELRLPRCSACGRWEWYPVESGPGCEGAHYEWENVGPSATVFSMTRVHRPLLPDVKEPYVTGLVVTDKAPNCRIAALLDESKGPIGIGARVALRIVGDGLQSFPFFVLEDRP